MRALIAMAALMTAVSNGLAQEFKDETINTLTADQKGALLDALLFAVADPFSTQVLEISALPGKEGDFCGLANTKNLNGAYSGFKVFKFSSATGKLSIDAECK